ncbi:aldehyde dehydrogenase family protein [Actinobacillus equuli subsp. haemolyticus]|uniref:aldehyde dehydrogenase family protein n=1 Tax=Actinobacillus equuli TaxID=718 RepID=UPI0024417B52|nr:aldehyde dehydrogenase family protein [Actinobacillus equuli]WGE63213.1 aldehyde dehydrogenase family protein [Actinobacillus equuli subsp. haemolyticus]WGE71348.1 aldehyde dehydrogenase family protein [Actinobacillus equuli subsp. haemolyticus]WGE81381.1 aldehyde dehydrogenase family protein [Actinobacillus equuli subsp. haemolyticus]WGE85604.1 aldehyde dehydrogenase family protein [Actinobacillus equuli subsp. haemolyticus]
MKNLNVFDKTYGLLINGEWTQGSGKDLLASYNPANGDVLAHFVDATDADVDAAVTAAQQAFKTWRKTTTAERAAILNKIADVIDEHSELFALQETLDNGKPIRETRAADIPLASDHFRYFASAIRAGEGSLNQINQEELSLVLREPIGVVGQIIPWNFPFLMAAWKIAPALAAGCTVVIHPSSTTSLSLLSFAQKINHLLPKGVLNVITGKGSKSGEYMLKHKGFNKLAFTGSTEVGRHIAVSAAELLIPATLELGGKSANIFFDDMPFDKALEGAQKGILFNQGQVCCAGSRIFVQEGIYDKFVAALAEEFKKVKVGLPWEDDTQMGAQVNAGQLNTILKYVKIGEEEGCRIITGGKKVLADNLANGEFVEPTLIESKDNNSRIAQEEIFGPVATVIKFKTEEDVIRMANDSEYGLGGGVWTKDINRALRVAQAIETGRIWVNCYNILPAGAPFGGYKSSGIGRETHQMMLDAYTQVKNIYISTREEREGMY